MQIDFCLETDIGKLIECQALEVYYFEDKRIANIPYMMNDAIECYLQFENCSIQGEWKRDYEGEITFSLVTNNDRNGIIFYQGTENRVTYWYDSVGKYLECYQYHRICHFWIKGNEKWRRLVYIIGTIHEKYSFMGEEVCNEDEVELYPLVEFAPFRYWTPLTDDIEEYYVDTMEGLLAIKRIAEEAGDRSFLRWIRKYQKAIESGRLNDRLVRRIANEMCRKKHSKIFDRITSQINRASLMWPERDYGEKQNQMMTESRNEVVAKYYDMGFAGTYPELKKGKRKIIFYEEHPYVIREFEYENFDFKIRGLE